MATLAIALYLKKHSKKESFAFLLYTLSTSYILLLGAGTEKNTYSMFAPVIALITFNFIKNNNQKQLIYILSMITLWLASYSLYKNFSINILFYTKPICTIVITLIIILWSIKESYIKCKTLQ